MRVKAIIVFYLLCFISSLSFGQTTSIEKVKTMLLGSWVDEMDTNHVLVFSADTMTFVTADGTQPPWKEGYTVMNRSCDTLFYKNDGSFFLLQVFNPNKGTTQVKLCDKIEGITTDSLKLLFRGDTEGKFRRIRN